MRVRVCICVDAYACTCVRGCAQVAVCGNAHAGFCLSRQPRWSTLPSLAPPPALCRQLRFLTLTNCELSALPPTVRQLPSLELLKLNINKIEVSSVDSNRFALQVQRVASD